MPTLETQTLSKTQRPKLFAVRFLNDDFTSFDFVIHVLERFFSKSPQESESLTHEIHTKGSAVVGIYTFEIAESMTLLVEALARQHEFPLKLDIAPA